MRARQPKMSSAQTALHTPPAGSGGASGNPTWSSTDLPRGISFFAFPAGAGVFWQFYKPAGAGVTSSSWRPTALARRNSCCQLPASAISGQHFLGAPLETRTENRRGPGSRCARIPEGLQVGRHRWSDCWYYLGVVSRGWAPPASSVIRRDCIARASFQAHTYENFNSGGRRTARLRAQVKIVGKESN
jgi:hypothetical protein